ncbi:MAG: DUF1934 domain-containing protein [Solobacterium sp.]|nr:DUF1934 domain-containing protein [Solobacterium sp.]
MRVRMVMKRTDLSSGEEEVFPAVSAILRDTDLLYREADTGASVCVSFKDDTVVIERKAEITSRTVLHKNRQGTSVVSSPYGTMELHTYMADFAKMFDKWAVTYKITYSEETAVEQKIEWMIMRQS